MIAERQCEMIIGLKLAHLDWGPKKVVDWLRRQHSSERWPADSTVGEILRREGLVQARRHRRRVAADTAPFGRCLQANAQWSADFKGDFALGNGRRCYPLTISDNYSRFVLACRGMARPQYRLLRPWFEWVFREYGLPQAIRTDNGSPFASLALGGVTQLSKWWIRLGIRPERIKPGKPNQNGRHERMHRSLESGVHPIQTTMAAQQRQFDRWVEDFNWERSHEALGRQTPGSRYEASPRQYPDKLPDIAYPSDVSVRQVRQNGEIKWRGQLIYISDVLAQEPISLRQIADGRWEIRYSFHLLGYLDERSSTVQRPDCWHEQQQRV
jgi:transposase InsO family protein